MAWDIAPLGPADLDRPVADRFLRVADLFGARVAIVDSEGAIDYRTFALKARAIASLIAAASGEGEPVALFLPATRTMPCAMMGALLAGRPYVPLDPSFPAEHLLRILSHSGAQVMICEPEHARAVLGDMPEGLRLISPHMPTAPVDLAPIRPDNPAYVLYTSGSTGTPKGVWQDQTGLLHDVMQFTQAVRLTPADRLSLLYSPAVNGAIRDIFGALLNGATLCMSDLRREGLSHVLEDLDRRKVTVLHAMPPVLRALMSSQKRNICPEARVLYTAGDRLLTRDLSDLRARLPEGCSVYTGIGSTECATLYREWTIPDGWAADGVTVPVGHAILDREMRLVDAGGQEVAAGEVGFIEISSPYIARGYWNDPALTKASFRPVSGRPGWRCFRPGDLGRVRNDGLLEFVGRADRQIKIRGYRLDPVEIEAALRELGGVRDAVVLAEEICGRVRVYAFVETASTHLSEDQMRRELGRQVPAHLVPDRIVLLSAMPRLANFKCDVGALRRMIPVTPDVQTDPDLPSGYLAIWSKALKRPVAAGDRLEGLGADSLALMEIELEVAERFGRSFGGLFTPEITPGALWMSAAEVQRPTDEASRASDTIRRLSILMARSTGAAVDAEGTMRGFNLDGDRTPLVWCFNNHNEAEALAGALGADQPLLAFRSLNGIVSPDAPDPWRERLVAGNAMQALDAVGSLASVVVGGNCQAAPIALNLANNLWTAGVHVASLIFMERALPIPYAGRHLVLFGAASARHNPRFLFAQPQTAWPRYVPRSRRADIPGAHGQFFQPRHVAALAQTLREEIDLARHDPSGPLGPAGRRVSLSAETTFQGDGRGQLKVRITNAGPMVWAEGAISGIALTVHSLAPSEQGRPHRKPDLTVPLPFALLPGETREISISFHHGLRTVTRLHLGLCEEGYHWFTEVT